MKKITTRVENFDRLAEGGRCQIVTQSQGYRGSPGEEEWAEHLEAVLKFLREHFPGDEIVSESPTLGGVQGRWNAGWVYSRPITRGICTTIDAAAKPPWPDHPDNFLPLPRPGATPIDPDAYRDTLKTLFFSTTKKAAADRLESTPCFHAGAGLVNLEKLTEGMTKLAADSPPLARDHKQLRACLNRKGLRLTFPSMHAPDRTSWVDLTGADQTCWTHAHPGGDYLLVLTLPDSIFPDRFGYLLYRFPPGERLKIAQKKAPEGATVAS